MRYYMYHQFTVGDPITREVLDTLKVIDDDGELGEKLIRISHKIQGYRVLVDEEGNGYFLVLYKGEWRHLIMLSVKEELAEEDIEDCTNINLTGG